MRQRLLDEPAPGGGGGGGGGSGADPFTLHAYTQSRALQLQAGGPGSEPSSSRSSSPELGGQPVFASRLAKGLTGFANQFQELPRLPNVDDADAEQGLDAWLPPAASAAARPRPVQPAGHAAVATADDAAEQLAGPEPPAESEDDAAAAVVAEAADNFAPQQPPEMSTVDAITAATFALAGMSSTIESCLVVLTCIALGGVLFILGDVLVPLILAVFIASMLAPFIDLLADRPLRIFGQYWCKEYWCDPALQLEQRWPNWFCQTVTSLLTIRFPTVLAMLTTIAMLGVVLCGAGAILFNSVSTFVFTRAQAYEDELQHWASDFAQSDFAQSLNTFRLRMETGADKAAPSSAVGVDPTDSSSVYSYLTQGGIESTFVQILEDIGSTLASGALIVMYVIFILLGRQARGERKGKAVTYAVEHQLKIYISWKFGISAVTGCLVGYFLSFLNVDLAAMFGLLTFGLNFIPTVGLLVAVILPLPVVVIAPSCDQDAIQDLIDNAPLWSETGFSNSTGEVVGLCQLVSTQGIPSTTSFQGCF